MKKPTKDELLGRYKMHEAVKFIQFEGGRDDLDHSDGYTLSRRPTFELLTDYPKIRVWIVPGTPKSTIKVVLERIMALIERTEEWELRDGPTKEELLDRYSSFDPIPLVQLDGFYGHNYHHAHVLYYERAFELMSGHPEVRVFVLPSTEKAVVVELLQKAKVEVDKRDGWESPDGPESPMGLLGGEDE